MKYLWRHLYKVGPTSSTLVQHCINVIEMFCVYWDYNTAHLMHFNKLKFFLQKVPRDISDIKYRPTYLRYYILCASSLEGATATITAEQNEPEQ